MNIEELNKEYKNKMDILMNEYKEKVKELEGTKEEPFIKEGQGYFCIRADFTVSNTDDYSNDSFDKITLGCGNCYPYTDDNYEEVFEEVKLIAERRKLQSEMEQFARLNNEGFDRGSMRGLNQSELTSFKEFLDAQYSIFDSRHDAV